MIESDFVKEFISDLTQQGVYIKKIPDFPVSYVEDETGKRKPRFIPTKPFDMFGCFPGGQSLCIEAKLQKKLGAFPLSSIRENQLEELISAGKCQAVAFFAINYRITIPKSDGEKVERQIEKWGLTRFVESRRLNLLTILLPYDILAAKSSKCKSIPMGELFDPEAACFIQRSRGGLWEVDKLIAAVHGRILRGVSNG